MTNHRSSHASAAGPRAVLFALAAVASLSAAPVHAQATDGGGPASSSAQLDPADAPKLAPDSRLGVGLDQQTRDQMAQASQIQQRMAKIGRLPDGVSSWNDAMVLGGNFGQTAKFNLAMRLHRWDIVGAMVGGYLLWLLVGVGVLSILGRLTRSRRSR